MNGATVVDNGKFDVTLTPAPNEFIGDGFKSLIRSSSGHDTVEFTVDFGAGVSNRVVSVYVQNSMSTEF